MSPWKERELSSGEQVRAFIRKNLSLHYRIWDLALEQPVKTRDGELVVTYLVFGNAIPGRGILPRR